MVANQNGESGYMSVDVSDEEALTREACLRLGILPDELKTKPLSAFGGPGVSNDIQQIRASHYEDKRKGRVRAVQVEKRKICEERR